jgi:uncharacterized protein (UPF0333 family)
LLCYTKKWLLKRKIWVSLMFNEERAQVSFEYLLTAVFGIMLAIGAAMVLESLRQIALQAQADMLTTRAEVIENILQ